MKVYLFFNYSHGENLPKHDYWINFVNPDSTKLALQTTREWERQGWEVVRLSTENITEQDFPPFTGQLQASQVIYELKFMQFWFAAHRVMTQTNPSCGDWFTTIDVSNQYFSPGMARDLVANHQPETMLAVQKQHFSASCLYLTPEGCKHAMSVIRAYDRGEHQKLSADLVSDETVLRHYGSYKHAPLASYALAEADWKNAPLIHMPRSILQHYHKHYPAVP